MRISRTQLRESLYDFSGPEIIQAHLDMGQLIRPCFRSRLFAAHQESRFLRAESAQFSGDNPMSYALEFFERTGKVAPLMEVADSLRPLGVVDMRIKAESTKSDARRLSALTLIYATTLRQVLGIESPYVERSI